MTVIVGGVMVAQWIVLPEETLGWRAFALALLLSLCATVALPGMLEKHRVCEHGLVLGYRRTATSRYTVPWSSLDPGRIRMLTRTQLLSRHPQQPTSSPHYRIGVGPLAYRALAVNGLDTATAGWVPVPGVLEATDTVTSGSRRRRTPYVWWVLGTPRPHRLAAAIEAAMVADGHPAEGLAARALDQACVLPWTPGRNPLPPRPAGARPLGISGKRLP